MKISVIMPVYNCERYLEKAISSVLAQDAELEIIAVDDGSCDGSPALLRALSQKDARVKAFFNGENKGVAWTRNFAMQMACGEFVTFCDADDYLPAGAYRAFLDASEGVDVVIAAHRNVFDDGSAEPISAVLPKDRSSVFRSLFTVSCLWTKMVRRDFLVREHISFDEGMRIGEDVVFLASLTVRKPLCRAIDGLVYCHCLHDVGTFRSLTHIYTLEAFKKHVECRERVLEICCGDPVVKDFIYLDFSHFLIDFITRISDRDELNASFDLLKAYFEKYGNWKMEAHFKELTRMTYGDFMQATGEGYVEHCRAYPARERVLDELGAGKMGLRWIVKYFFKWLEFKLGGTSKRG